MSRKQTTIRLLLINASDNDTERLVSLFRGAGRVARARRVLSADDLEGQLAKPWDLLIADDHHPELTVEQCLGHLKQRRAELPVIVVRAGADLSALFAAGARDVVAPEEEPRLLGAALRELGTGELHRAVDRLRRQLAEAEQRNALLLGESEQAIAYVADGMLISVNPLFAERFGYADAVDLDGATVMDLIAAEDQESVKSTLKAGSGSAAFTGLRADGGSFPGKLMVSGASYDGEPCIQLSVGDAAAGGDAGSSERDDETGLYSRHHLLQQLQLQPPGGGSLLLIGIDDFAALRRQLGFSGARALAAAVGRRLQAANPLPRALLARAGDDCFALLAADTAPEAAAAEAAHLNRAIGEHIFELGDQSLQCTVSIGVAALANGSTEVLLDRAQSALDGVQDEGGNGAAVDSQQPERRALHGDGEEVLQEALDDDRFALLFQPVISLRGAAGEHYEVLLRMQGETDALELPDNFLDGLGVSAGNARLDRWVLLEATKRLADSRAQGHDTRLLINLSANALQDEGLGAWLGVALKAAGLPPQSVILQLRDVDVNNYLKPARTFADAVRQLGCRVSLSGFGRASDPLKTLKNLGVDLVQMDGQFTRGLQGGEGAQALRELVAALNGRDIRVIVPFVENAAVLATLWQVGADFIQGHYLQAPAREMNYEFTDIA
jgi:diguanylate cyclase (GGDEF)-like protein/PAS domain S-box-containing protein